tara:strand:+ start:26 stop:538 length:513 start_codon:yes stop_codon:yes gene_type:complete
MTHKVIDNFLEKDQYISLKNLITNLDFPWRRRLNLTQDGHPSNNGYFTFCFYNHLQPQSEWFQPFIVPMLTKLKAASVIQVRANMHLKELFGEAEIPFHLDYDDLKKFKTAILNFSDDGGTRLKINNNKYSINAKENRLLLMDGNTLHSTIRNDKISRRYLLNLNYMSYE